MCLLCLYALGMPAQHNVVGDILNILHFIRESRAVYDEDSNSPHCVQLDKIQRDLSGVLSRLLVMPLNGVLAIVNPIHTTLPSEQVASIEKNLKNKVTP